MQKFTYRYVYKEASLGHSMTGPSLSCVDTNKKTTIRGRFFV